MQHTSNFCVLSASASWPFQKHDEELLISNGDPDTHVNGNSGCNKLSPSDVSFVL